MKERPILFSGPMVRAILEGRKTQTRRIINPQPPEHIDRLHGNALRKRFPYQLEDDSGNPCGKGFQDDNHQFWRPVGLAGDRLWVKETFSAAGVFGEDGRKFYRADYVDGKHPSGLHWKPSIFCTRKASRITLEIVNVRVERLQDISEQDAAAEGCKCPGCMGDNLSGCPDCKDDYRLLWNRINGPSSWDKNPWVWVIEFKRV